ncbi:hypothetical protein D3C81_827330 [compost metagenome]
MRQRAVVEIGDIDDRVVGRSLDDRVEIVLAGVGAEHQLVLAAKQLERPGGVQIHTKLGVFVVCLRNSQPGVVTGYPVRVGRQKVRVRPDRVHRQRQLPLVVEVVSDIAEQAVVVAVQVRPLAVEVGGARQRVERAVEAGIQAAPVIAILVVLLEGGANGEYGGIIQVRFADQVQQLVVAPGAITVAVGIVVVGHRSTTDVALIGQRAGYVHLAAIVVPGASPQFRAQSKVARRALANQVDGRRGVAGALHQAIGTAHNFNPVVDGHVRRGHDVHGVVFRDVGRNAVVLQVVDLEAARVVGGAIGAELGQGDPGDSAGNVVEVLDVLVVHLLAGHNGHRLRRLAQAHGHFGGGGADTGGVGAGAFGGGAEGYGADGCGVQFHH